MLRREFAGVGVHEEMRGPYPAGAVADPRGPAEGAQRIIRGGSWFNEPEALRSANRQVGVLPVRSTRNNYNLVGFKP